MNITIGRPVFKGLYSYEIVLLVLGVVPFLVAVRALIQKIRTEGSLFGPLAILPFVLVFVGYPSVQAVQFNNAVSTSIGLVSGPGDMRMLPEQEKAAAKSAAIVAARGETPQMQALAANAYRALGATKKAYRIAQPVLAKDPPSAVRQALVPVVTARLEQITPADPAEARVSAERRREIATVAEQLQAQTATLPAASRLALAKAQLALGNRQSAEAHAEAALRLDPQIVINPALKRAIRVPSDNTQQGESR